MALFFYTEYLRNVKTLGKNLFLFFLELKGKLRLDLNDFNLFERKIFYTFCAALKYFQQNI